MSATSTVPSLRDAFFRQGKVLDCPIYDMHGHMHSFRGGFLPRNSPEAMIATMERAGVKLIVFCSHSTLGVPDIGNTVNIEAVRRFPEHFRAYCGINPNHPEQVRRDVDTFDQHSDVYVGFKFLADYHKVAITDTQYEPAWQLAQERGLLVLLHTWGGSSYDGPKHVRECAEKYPNATILMGHSCHGDWDGAIALVQDFPKVYCELTAVLDDRGVVDKLVRECGSSRIVFGTDSPWFNHHYYIGSLLGADITDDDRRNICYRNAQRLLKPLM